MVPVNYNDIKVTVDGEELKTDKEPFIYEGTTYLPVRAVAEAVGKEVGWDSATKTVTLTSIKQEPEEEEIKEGTAIIDKNIVDQNGIKIRCLDMDSNIDIENSDYHILKFRLKNFTSMNYEIAVKELYVNGKLIEPLFYAELLPIAQVQAELLFYKKDLDSTGITELKEIRIIFHVENRDDYASSFDTEEATIKIAE